MARNKEIKEYDEKTIPIESKYPVFEPTFWILMYLFVDFNIVVIFVPMFETIEIHFECNTGGLF
jgi:hypothetical protein